MYLLDCNDRGHQLTPQSRSAGHLRAPDDKLVGQHTIYSLTRRKMASSTGNHTRVNAATRSNT